MFYFYRFAIVLCLFVTSTTPSLGQNTLVLDTEVRAVQADRVILLGGAEYPVLVDEDGEYGPRLDNYSTLLRVGYIDLARLHIVQGVVVQVEVIRMLQ